MATVKEALDKFKTAAEAHQAAQEEQLEGIKTSVEGITGDLTWIKSELDRLNNSPGTISAEDQATLDGIIAKMASLNAGGADVRSRLQALDSMTPPVPPVV